MTNHLPPRFFRDVVRISRRETFFSERNTDQESEERTWKVNQTAEIEAENNTDAEEKKILR